LEVIASLSNTDKHQTIHSAGVVIGNLQKAGLKVTPRGDREATANFRWNQSAGKPIHEAELVAVRLDPPEADVDLEGNPNVVATVAFGERRPVDPRGRVSLSVEPVEFGQLDVLIAEVRRVVDLLEPFTR
jgi:hypothetical protein